MTNSNTEKYFKKTKNKTKQKKQKKTKQNIVIYLLFKYTRCHMLTWTTNKPIVFDGTTEVTYITIFIIILLSCRGGLLRFGTGKRDIYYGPPNSPLKLPSTSVHA